MTNAQLAPRTNEFSRHLQRKSTGVAAFETSANPFTWWAGAVNCLTGLGPPQIVNSKDADAPFDRSIRPETLRVGNVSRRASAATRKARVSTQPTHNGRAIPVHVRPLGRPEEMPSDPRRFGAHFVLALVEDFVTMRRMIQRLREEAKQVNWLFWVPILLSVVVVWLSWIARVRLIDAALPYCQHGDEQLWMERAIHILKTGDLNPHRFTKPSVMVYLTTAGLVLGIMKAGMAGGSIVSAQHWIDGGYPYYSMPEAVRVPRLILAALSIGTMCLSALIASAIYRDWYTRQNPHSDRRSAWTGAAWVGLLTLGGLALSPHFLRSSWLYINVDAIGCFTLVSAIAYLLFHRKDASAFTVALITGVLIGLCIGTKYNFYPIFLPAFLMVAFEYRDRFVPSCLTIVVTAVFTFFLTTPYAILDLPTFTWAAARQAQHYANESIGVAVGPGIPMFIEYGKSVFGSFSPVFGLLACYGLYRAIRNNWRQTLIIASFPVVLWFYMSRQGVFYHRNALMMHVCVAIYAALGAVWLFQASKDWLWAQRSLVGKLPARPALLVAVGLLAVITSPLHVAAEVVRATPESRVQVTKWIQREVPKGSVILIANELEMDTRPLKKHFKVKKYSAKKRELKDLYKRYPGAIALAPEFNRGPALGGLSAKQVKVVTRLGKKDVNVRVRKFVSTSTGLVYGNPKLTVLRLQAPDAKVAASLELGPLNR